MTQLSFINMFYYSCHYGHGQRLVYITALVCEHALRLVLYRSCRLWTRSAASLCHSCELCTRFAADLCHSCHLSTRSAARSCHSCRLCTQSAAS